MLGSRSFRVCEQPPPSCPPPPLPCCLPFTTCDTPGLASATPDGCSGTPMPHPMHRPHFAHSLVPALETQRRAHERRETVPCRRELLRAPEPQTLTAQDPHSRSSSKLHGNPNRFAGRSHPSANSPCPLHRHTETTRAHTDKLMVPVCGARGSHKFHGSPTPLCPTHPGYGLGRAEWGEGQMLEKCIPRPEAAEQRQDTL